MASTKVIVTVLNGKPEEREGTFKGRDGEQIAYTTRKQEAKIQVGEFAYPFEVRIEQGQQPYPPGAYEIDFGAMLEVNKKNASLSKYHRLVPVK